MLAPRLCPTMCAWPLCAELLINVARRSMVDWMVKGEVFGPWPGRLGARMW